MNEDNYIPCACIHCGWVDGFLAELVEPKGSRIGFCDSCGQEYEFKPVVNLLAELSATKAELDGADKVIAHLKAENAKLRKIAAYVPGGVWIIAEERAGFGNAVKCNEKV